MNVKELIAALKKLDPELEVHVWDFGWGDHVPVGKLDVHDNHVVLECIIQPNPS